MPTPNGPAVSSAAASAASAVSDAVKDTGTKKWATEPAKGATQIAAAGVDDTAVGRAAASKGTGEMSR